jgi:branched-subunit amino acid transport protein AzlD
MDSYWIAVIVGSLAVYFWKILGYALPKRFAENKEVVVLASKLTIALLAALTAIQTFSVGQSLTFDSRVAAVGVAALLYWLKAPFIVAVCAAALVAAVLRGLLGWA